MINLDKRYQVFVSSTFEDLQEERKEVMQALLELDCIPSGMELFPASNDDQWTLIKNVIDDCDYYLLIIGGRYGSENDEGISYTQMEFEYALQQGKPMISFLPKNPDAIPSGKCETSADKQQKLEKFKELAKKKLVKFWDGPDNLGSVVSRSMVRLIKDYPAEGWVKSGSIVDEDSIKEIARLQKENNELKERFAAMTTQAPRGAENLSQGDDDVEISFEFVGTNIFGEIYECSSSIVFTWNKIFSYIAPSMMDECSESEMKRKLCDFIDENKGILSMDKEFDDFTEFSSFKILQSAFDLIKVQFKALGLICISTKKQVSKSIGTYWRLTPYGEYMMTQLVAMRKK